MKLVFLLGVLSLLALSISAQPETPLTAPSETSLTALSRGVRQASKEARGRQNRGSKSKKARKGKKGKKASKANGLEGKRRKDGKGKKSANGKGRKQGKGKRRGGRKNKGGKGKSKKGNKRQNPKKQKTQKNLRNEQTCTNFFTAPNAKDLTYALNQQRKRNKIDSILKKLDKKRDKSATAFSEAADFFRDCPAASGIYNILSQCNVTARDFCDTRIFFDLYPTYETLYQSNCTAILSATVDSGKKCNDNCPLDPDDECNYIAVPRNDSGNRECSFVDFETALKAFDKICFNPDVEGSFSNCTRILKDSYGKAKTCFSDDGCVEELPDVVITSNGAAARASPTLIGFYERTVETVNSRPIFKKLGIDYYIWWHDYGAWWVGYSVVGSGSVSGSMYAPGDGDLPPTTGWYHYNGGSFTNNDPSLMAVTVLPFSENGRLQIKKGIELEVNNIGPLDIGNGTLPLDE